VDSKLLQGFYLKDAWVAPPKGDVRSNGRSVHLLPQAMDVLLCLASRASVRWIRAPMSPSSQPSGAAARIAAAARRFGGLAALAVCLGLPMAHGATPGVATVVYLVRHAEKTQDSDDPALRTEGVARAEALAEIMRDAGVTAVHSTDFRRTRDTAAPTAARLGLDMRGYHWDEMDALAAAIRHEGGRHLVVGHSDTTPELVGLLGGDPGAPIDEPTEYDRLYIVTLGPDGTVTTVLLRYGL